MGEGQGGGGFNFSCHVWSTGFRLLKFSLCAGKFVLKPLVKPQMKIPTGVKLQGLRKPCVYVKYGNGHLV